MFIHASAQLNMKLLGPQFRDNLILCIVNDGNRKPNYRGAKLHNTIPAPKCARKNTIPRNDLITRGMKITAHGIKFIINLYSIIVV